MLYSLVKVLSDFMSTAWAATLKCYETDFRYAVRSESGYYAEEGSEANTTSAYICQHPNIIDLCVGYSVTENPSTPQIQDNSKCFLNRNARGVGGI